MYQLKNIYKSYDENKNYVLHNLSLTIKKGDFIAIIGSSGSGKTTLLKILSTLDKPSEGHYIYDDCNLEKLSNNELATFRNQHIGIVFQEYNLIKNMTVNENILLPTIFNKEKNYSERFDNIVNTLRISNLLDKKASLLSGGEQQRVAIARAMINKPDLILADEPTGNLDSDNSNQLFNLLKVLNEQGVTVLTVTHNLEFAKKFKEIYELKNGAVEKIS